MVKRVEETPCRWHMTRWERKQLERIRKADKAENSFRYRTVILAVAVMLLLISGLITQTHSYFTARAENRNNFFQAASIDSFLSLEPGKAQATFPAAAGDPKGETPTVAQEKDGQITLDFGEVVEGSGRNFDDVLKIHNVSGENLNVRWRIDGEIASVIDRTEGSFILVPDSAGSVDRLQQEAAEDVTSVVYGEEEASNLCMDEGSGEEAEYSLNMKLNVRRGPGVYSGDLVLTVNGEFLSVRVPARVVVREKAPVAMEEALNMVGVPVIVEPTKDPLEMLIEEVVGSPANEITNETIDTANETIGTDEEPNEPETEVAQPLDSDSSLNVPAVIDSKKNSIEAVSEDPAGNLPDDTTDSSKDEEAGELQK
ncbi:hypothetical protein [Phosphitispora fastidiosa]|uniref:hypothetical protein n=1 Tax=Phosphitispora fastidiosa TaxID=2837202 RepID=UPI001E35B149|nr:hypothetical protein [Phosphitispora fastidiosa]MBU7005676.1 hypothetical protein [Phosphitispora fastidiosa]